MLEGLDAHEHRKRTKVHLFLIKPRSGPSPMSAPLARGGAVRLDLVPSRELLLVVQALVVVLLGLRAAMASTARPARRARTRRPRGDAGEFVVGIFHALLEGLEELVAAALAAEGAEARRHAAANLLLVSVRQSSPREARRPLAGTRAWSRRSDAGCVMCSDAHCVVCSDAANTSPRLGRRLRRFDAKIAKPLLLASGQ